MDNKYFDMNNEVKLQKITAQSKEFSIFLKMLQALFDEGGNHITVNPKHPDLFDDKKDLFLIQKNSQNIGIIRYDRNDTSYRFLRTFYIIPEKRKQGIGTYVVAMIEELAITEQVYELVLNADKSAELFYQKLNFKKDYWKGDGKNSIPYGKSLNNI